MSAAKSLKKECEMRNETRQKKRRLKLTLSKQKDKNTNVTTENAELTLEY